MIGTRAPRGGDLLVERPRIVAALGDDQPRPREDRRELALEKRRVVKRLGGQPFCDTDVVVDVRDVHARDSTMGRWWS